MSNAVDRYSELLHSAGWSIGEISYRDATRYVWQVDCRRSDDVLLVRAPGQVDAWRTAWKLATKLG